MTVDVTFRGWPGHFILGHRCLFHLNTLLEKDDKKIVVSTVGSLLTLDEKIDTIGAGGRYYETKAYQAKMDSPYWDADFEKELTNLLDEWSICASSLDELPDNSDDLATTMHYNAITRIAQLMEDGTL